MVGPCADGSIKQSDQLQLRALEKANDYFNDHCNSSNKNNIDARFLSPSAVKDLEIVSLLLELGLNPYHSWNMLYFSLDEKLAFISDALMVTETANTSRYTTTNAVLYEVDRVMQSHLQQATKTWEKTKDVFMQDGDLSRLMSIHDYLKSQIENISAKMKNGIYHERKDNLGAMVNICMTEIS